MGEAGCEIKVAHAPDSYHISRGCERSYLFHEIDLVTNIKKRERFVEKKITAAWAGNPQLRKHAREMNPLAFAAAERLILSLTELRRRKVRHDFVDDLFVCWSRVTAKVW